MTRDAIDLFLDALVSVPSGEDYINIYREYKTCRDNLELYLRHMTKANVSAALIGEAPGYRGCARTGIPFTDEKHLLDLKEIIPELHLLGENEDRKPMKELSAGIIWDVLLSHKDTSIIMWNVFPFHPNKGCMNSNRTPRNRETEIGLVYLDKLMNIFPEVPLYAVGRTAQKKLGLSDSRYIRHPSHGGACRCTEDLERKVFGQLRGQH